MPKNTNDQQESDLPAGLSAPARHALAAAGIVRLEQFAKFTAADVLKLHGMGPNAMEKIRRALAANGLSLADGPRKRGAVSNPPSTHATLDDWIAGEAMPLSLDAPATFNAAVDTAIASLGDAVTLLGFGEALHGGEEILILRNRLFQRLVETHGYSAIAIESSFPWRAS